METYIKDFGTKKLYFEQQEDGSWLAHCTCQAMQARVEVRLTADQAQELRAQYREWAPGGRPIQDILANVPRQLREIFVTGLTPAEWDLTMCGEPFQKRNYAELGYVFPEGINSLRGLTEADVGLRRRQEIKVSTRSAR